MKVLVTGSSGLLGMNLRKYVNSLGDKDDTEWVFVTSKDADLRDIDETRILFLHHRPTHVINLAACVGGLYKNMRNNVEMFRYNMLMTDNVLLCSYEYNCKLVNILSTCIFPDTTQYPIREEYLHDGPPHWSNMGYSYAKRMIDVLTRAYNNQYQTNFSSLILGNLYGEWDNYNLEDAHVVPALIHKCHTACKDNTDFIIRGTGTPLRQFTYAHDVARLIVKIMHMENPLTDPLIISTQEERSIHNLATMIAQEMGFTRDIVYDKSYSDGQYKKTISNDRVHQLFPDFKFTSLQQGLKQTVQWFRENYPENIRI